MVSSCQTWLFVSSHTKALLARCLPVSRTFVIPPLKVRLSFVGGISDRLQTTDIGGQVRQYFYKCEAQSCQLKQFTTDAEPPGAVLIIRNTARRTLGKRGVFAAFIATCPWKLVTRGFRMLVSSSPSLLTNICVRSFTRVTSTHSLAPKISRLGIVICLVQNRSMRQYSARGRSAYVGLTQAIRGLHDIVPFDVP